MDARDTEYATKSLNEERKAISDYTHRLKTSSNAQLKKAINTALKDEKEHAGLFSKILK